METSFEPKTHTYRIDGKRATGVTTIIGVLAKPQLIGWASRMAVEYVKEHAPLDTVGLEIPLRHVTDEILENARVAHTRKKEDAGQKGTDMHALVEEYINACLTSFEGKPVAPKEGDVIKQFTDWAVENVEHFIFAERQMYNKDLFIAGTADFAYVGKDGKKYMADFKTSSGIYGIDYWLQVAAYRMLAEAEGDEVYDGATVVRMGKDGSFDVQKLYEYETYKEAFLCCLTLYRAQAAIKGLIIKE